MVKKKNISIDQGTSFDWTEKLTDSLGDVPNLANCQVTGTIKRWYTSSNSIPFSANLNANTGDLTLSLTANTTYSTKAGRYVYSVLMTHGNGKVEKIYEGIATVNPTVS